MKSVCFSALAAALLLTPTALAGAQSDTVPTNFNVMLCDTPAHAISYAVAIEKGAADDQAKDIVGRAARAEVCDKFIGLASVDEERTLLEMGVTYKVTALKFPGVGKMRWLAIPHDR